MRVVFDPIAEINLANQLDYLIANDAARAARRLELRVFAFIELTLANQPRFGDFIAECDLWETLVPARTSFSGIASRTMSCRSFAYGIRRRID